MEIPVIKAKKFILRPYRQGDALSLRKHINNEKISRNTSHIPYPYTQKDAREWVQECLGRQKQKRPSSINFAIAVRGKVVGGIGFNNIEPRHKAEIGYWLGEQYWGRGMMTQAVNLVTRFGFEQLNLQRIFACVYPHNSASMRVLEKAGYKFEGVFRKYVKKGEEFIDGHIFAKVK